MHLSKVNECFGHRINGGSEYGWKSFGPNARYLDFESEFAHGSVVFDCETQVVYLADIDAKQDGDDNLPGRKEQPNDEPIVVVRVKNSTAEPDGTFKDYFIRVPPTITNASHAVAWTFGIEPHEYYDPMLET